jgi:hypothetical protein
MEKDCSPTAFPVILNITSYAIEGRSHYIYQLTAIISHKGDFNESPGYYIGFVGAVSQRLESNDMDVEAVEKSAALQGNLQETKGPTQTASILHCVADNRPKIGNFLTSFTIKLAI